MAGCPLPPVGRAPKPGALLCQRKPGPLSLERSSPGALLTLGHVQVRTNLCHYLGADAVAIFTVNTSTIPFLRESGGLAVPETREPRAAALEPRGC